MKEIMTAVAPIRSDFPAVSGIRDISGFIRFVEWMATPKHLRVPDHQKDFAEEIGVHQDTLTDWKRHPQFFLLVQAKVLAAVQEYVPDAINALCERASFEGKPGQVKLLLQLAGVLGKK